MASDAGRVSSTGTEQVLAALTDASAGGTPAVLATVIATEGSVPRHIGTKMVVLGGGEAIGTIGGGKVEDAIKHDALDTLVQGEPEVRTYTLQDPSVGDPGVCGGTMTIYLEPYMTPHTVFIIGCGHVGRAVVDLAHWLGYRTIAVDDRDELMTAEAMPNADVRFNGSVADAIATHPVTSNSSVVVVTRSHALDAEIVPLLVETPARYIGVMGSKRRWASTKELLAADAVDSAALDEIHNPIGFDIGAETVEEIAVSIMSEVIGAGSDQDS